MSIWLDEKYLRLVSPQLDRFTHKSSHNYNFRCPLCGDSERVRTKARGYIFAKHTVLMYKCHNCQVALPFNALLKRLSKFLYDQYIFETLQADGRAVETRAAPAVVASPPRVVPAPSPLTPLSECSSPQNALYDVYAYAVGRQIPLTQLHRLDATNRAYSWLRPLVGEDKASKITDGPLYLVQPLTLPDGYWYGAQLRAIAAKDYITFRWNNDPLKVFGLSAWTEGDTYIMEGPIDALFVPNAVAGCGSDLLGTVRVLEEQRIFPYAMPRVFVWDNEPRNKEVARNVRTAIQLNESVVIWPRHFPKDINDMVRIGISQEEVLDTMKKRTFSGLSAELEFSAWKK